MNVKFDPNVVFSLEDKVIIVTGGGTGIGKVYSQRLAAGGAKVVLADIANKEADEVARGICETGGTALSVPTDVSSEEAVQNMVKTAVEEFGGIDGLINNASLMSVLPRGNWFEISAERWDSVMSVNLKGIFLCCRAVYPYMQKLGGGRIVNISSGRIWEGNPNRLDYTTSKAGVVGLTRALAREIGDDNISVNAITPGFTLSETQLATSSSNYLGGRDEGKCFKRPQTPDDLVGTVIFLLSDAAGYITGQTVNVDGGLYMH